MSMVSLKLPKESTKGDNSTMPTISKPSYPYGTRITLNEKELKKLPSLDTIQAGQEVMIMAKAKVVEVATADVDGEDKRQRVEIQITDIDIRRPETDEFKEQFER